MYVHDRFDTAWWKSSTGFTSQPASPDCRIGLSVHLHLAFVRGTWDVLHSLYDPHSIGQGRRYHYHYAGSFLKGYPPIALWLRQWAQRDGCTAEPDIFFKQANVIGEKWTGCRDHVTIIHYVIGGMGHMWPRHIVIRS